VSQIGLFLSSASRKAWVAGIVAALLSPLYAAITSADVLDSRTLVGAILGGVLAAVSVFATRNADTDPVIQEIIDDEPGEHAADR
jgi:hypothetical protein